ncbi:phage recombination protein Bet [Massilia violaceinigra]|uniref:Phage recombination protein Bet n=1 Tax=Massilia violaceinigra TaxID=2045208 RepID=A0ABY4A7Z6_9BURK|nr:phage recombination protein Bet [Massilia violaceinigra]UOD28748.1 phage recombination protein Bet [Massilia violaceinigra]
MSNLAVQQQVGLAPQTEADVILVLQNSLYPGANINSVHMVLDYCRAAGLDPMQKPVHIVPMYDKNSRQMRDVVMPGISLYRTQAARTNEHVGTDEPVFGPMVELTLGGKLFQVPEWCKVTVWRKKDGERCAFTALEYWIENYATAGKDSDAPNAMWKKRSRGQISKCAEAQALRKGFPEVGSAPTAEEMEGKTIGPEIDSSQSANVLAITQDWAAAAAACATTEEVTAVWKVAIKELQAAGDMAEYDRVKAAVAKRGKELTATLVEHVEPMTDAEVEAADFGRGVQP